MFVTARAFGAIAQVNPSLPRPLCLGLSSVHLSIPTPSCTYKTRRPEQGHRATELSSTFIFQE